MTLCVRPMRGSDATAVAELTRQLGYEVTSQDIADRHDQLGNVVGSIALVADEDGDVVGWIQALDRILLQEKRVLEIGGMVVDDQRRGQGIGGQLVEAIADWAQHNSHTTLFVRSNVLREGAHDFYPALGFVHQKTSHTYVMELEQAESRRSRINTDE